ncbi:MAG: hypothetical protein GWN30_35900, partial [Gammaproteobacteria bacterium]|nr:hypothetical protein [Gammaproteobacteria bacterium]
GLGLAFYALGLALDILSESTLDPTLNRWLAQWGWPLLFLPGYFWFGSLLYLLPESSPWRNWFGRSFWIAFIPFALLFYLLAAATELIITVEVGGIPRPGPWYGVFAALILLEMSGILILLFRT